MLPALKLEFYFRYIRVLLDERLSHFQPPVIGIQLIGISSLHRHRGRLASQESQKENRTATVFEHAQRQVGILIVPSTPAVLNAVPNQHTGVYPSLDVKPWKLLLTLREEVIVETSEVNTLKAIVEHLRRTEWRSSLKLNLRVAA